MSEEPQLPPIPSIGDILTRKKNMEEFKYSVLKCECGKKIIRDFKEGDFVFKKIDDIVCEKCHKTNYTITEIYAEFKKVKK